MRRRLTRQAVWLSAWLSAGLAQAYQQSPSLDPLVAAGALPAVAQRLPAQPQVTRMADIGRKTGRHGGALRMLMGKAKDVRLMVVFGNARLVTLDPNFTLRPDILKRVDVDRSQVFTLHLRPGHKWSDGQPFTAEDFRYWWEDIANHDTIKPFGLPASLIVNGSPPRFEVLDDYTVRYAWDAPNPRFLPALAAPRPTYIYAPAHYLKQFHAKYAEPDALAHQVKRARKRNWGSLHNSKDRPYKLTNPDLPSLQPWVITTKMPSERFVFKRNPYFHRVDGAGNQLPYVDTVTIAISSSGLIPARAGAGESDLQARYLQLTDYTFLKQGAKHNDFDVRLWRRGDGSQVALYPNFNVKDPIWREVLWDVRVRRALSLGINRREINQVVYFGLVDEGNNTVLPDSALYRDDYRTRWAQYDVAQANRLLDQAGLSARDAAGLRLLPDGRPFEIVVQTAGESTEQTDVLQLITDSWSKLGVKLLVKPSQREVLRRRIAAGQVVMSVWTGHNGAYTSANLSPAEWAPSKDSQPGWPQWGNYQQTHGRSGERCPFGPVRELIDAHAQWRRATTAAAREHAWRRILTAHAENQFSIGTVQGAPQPVVVHNRLRNVPQQGIYSYSPTGFFGAYRMDAFYWAE